MGPKLCNTTPLPTPLCRRGAQHEHDCNGRLPTAGAGRVWRLPQPRTLVSFLDGFLGGLQTVYAENLAKVGDFDLIREIFSGDFGNHKANKVFFFGLVKNQHSCAAGQRPQLQAERFAIVELGSPGGLGKTWKNP